jgi:putative peptidoglycan lipid II flippase
MVQESGGAAPADGGAAASAAQVAAEGDRSQLVRRAGIVGLGTLLSRLLGLLRDIALAAYFPRDATDAFFVAFTIPNALRQILGEGAVSSAVVPVLAERLVAGGDDAARTFFAKIRGASWLALSVVTVIGVLAARPLTELFASGYHARPEQFERTVQFTRTVFPYIFFIGACALGGAALNAKRKFAVAAFAPGLLNVAFLLAAWLLPGPLRKLGVDPSLAIVGGALLGGVLQLAAQAPALRAIGYSGLPRFDLADPHVREVFRRLGPQILGIGVYYIDLVISRRFLSGAGAGAQSHFTWAMRLCDFPQGIFVMALSTAALPALSTLAAQKNLPELRKTVALGLRLSLFVALPASALLAFVPEPLVAAMFQRGEFSAWDVVETSRSLALQGAAVFTVALVRQAVPVFYALGDTKTPVLVSIADLLVFVIVAWCTRNSLGHVGVSLAVLASSAVQMLLLLVLLHGKLKGFQAAEVFGSAARTLVASAIAVAAARGVLALVGGLAGSQLGRVTAGVAVVVAFGIGFLVVAAALRAPELTPLLRGVRRRLGRA